MSYSKNPDGVAFVNPSKWIHHHLFDHVAIWDVPLVKPRFTYSVDTSLSLEGYDVAAELDKLLASFNRGGHCESGFVRKHDFAVKQHVEFGAMRGVPMPNIEDFDISVMYRASQANAIMLFNISLPTVIKRLPSAREVVVVVDLQDGQSFRDLVQQHQAASPFPIRVVTEAPLTENSKDIQHQYSQVCLCGR